jgi:parallel beta-helix repeat protein
MRRLTVTMTLALGLMAFGLPSDAETPDTRLAASSPQMRLSRGQVDNVVRWATAGGSEPFVAGLLGSLPVGQIALVIESGSFSLASLEAETRAKGVTDLIERHGNAYRLHAPLIVWSGASMVVGPGESLQMDVDRGAFLLNAGNLSIDRAEVFASAGKSSNVTKFQPFILTVQFGAANLTASHFMDLGYGDRLETSGISYLGRGALIANRQVLVRNNQFDRIGGLSFDHVAKAVVSGNDFRHSDRDSIVLRASSDIMIDNNQVTSSARHGVKLFRGSHSISLAKNTVEFSGGNGIFLDAGSSQISSRDNILHHNAKAGIVVVNGACIDLSNNISRNNKLGGMVLSGVLKTKVDGNRLGNNSIGLSIENQTGSSPVRLSNNIFTHNGVGLRGDGSGPLLFASNSFSDQWPRIFDGRIAGDTGIYLTQKRTAPERDILLAGDRSAAPMDMSAFSPFALARCTSEMGG